ncbi:MAG: hypothetical protein ACK4N5_00620 [Myxococcales bacterium]
MRGLPMVLAVLAALPACGAPEGCPPTGTHTFFARQQAPATATPRDARCPRELEGQLEFLTETQVQIRTAGHTGLCALEAFEAQERCGVSTTREDCRLCKVDGSCIRFALTVRQAASEPLLSGELGFESPDSGADVCSRTYLFAAVPEGR